MDQHNASGQPHRASWSGLGLLPALPPAGNVDQSETAAIWKTGAVDWNLLIVRRPSLSWRPSWRIGRTITGAARLDRDALS